MEVCRKFAQQLHLRTSFMGVGCTLTYRHTMINHNSGTCIQKVFARTSIRIQLGNEAKGAPMINEEEEVEGGWKCSCTKQKDEVKKAIGGAVQLVRLSGCTWIKVEEMSRWVEWPQSNIDAFSVHIDERWEAFVSWCWNIVNCELVERWDLLICVLKVAGECRKIH